MRKIDMKKRNNIIIIFLCMILLGVIFYFVLYLNSLDIKSNTIYKTINEKNIIEFIEKDEQLDKKINVFYENDRYHENNANALSYVYLNDSLVEIRKKEKFGYYVAYEGRNLSSTSYSIVNFVIDEKENIILSKNDNISFKILKTKCGYFFNNKSSIYTTNMKYLGFYSENTEILKEYDDGIYLHDVPENYCYCPPGAVCSACQAPYTFPLVKFNCNGDRIN